MKVRKIRLVLLLVVVTAAIIAQTVRTGSITGIITNANTHAALQGVKVNLKKDGRIFSATTTNQKGEYVFSNISIGTYSLEAFKNPFDTFLFAKLNVREGKQSILNIQLKQSQGKVAIGDTVRKEHRKIDVEPEQQNALPYVHTEEMQMQERSLSKNIGAPVNSKVSCDMRYSPPPPTQNWNTEGYDKIDDNEFKDVRHNPLSTFSIDVDAASYSNMRRFITQGSLPPKDAVRIEEMINYFTYDYKQPTGTDPFSISTEISTCPWNEKHRLIHIGLQGKDIATENLPANNLVFLIDVSGSMNQENKLPLLKKAFALLVDQLRDEDRVAIVVYAGNAGLVLPSTSGNEKEKILAAIDNLQAGGSTAGGAGIKLAYKIAKENFREEGNNRVILATDGDFNIGASSDAEMTRLIEEKREGGVFLTVLGFGMGNYKDSKMEKLADKGNGNYAYIDNIMEANKVFVKEMGATLNTIAKDVKLQIEFNPSKVKAYRLVGYENRLLAKEDFNDDKKDAGELGSGHAVTAMYEIISAGSDENISSVDPLKYQKNPEVKFADNLPKDGFDKANGKELMTVKFRYKEPNGSVSKLIVHPLVDKQINLTNTSTNFRFAAAVAEFGMILRDSKFKGDANYKETLALARASKGKDHEGYRAEFIRLVETAELLSKGSVRNEE